MPDTSQLDRLLAPRSVALIGASGDPEKTAGRPGRYLREHGYAGQVFIVNPRYQSIDGVTCYPSVADLPATPDVGLVLVGPDRASEAVRELAARGTPAAIVLAGGYAETGAAGKRRQEELRAAAGSMRLLGPNSIGLVNVTASTVLSPSGALEIKPLQPGKIALVSQSGGVLGSLLSRAIGRGIGISKLVATGNEADLEVLDFVEYFLEDDGTNVITLYLEGLREPRRLRTLAERAKRVGKPIVAYKVGRSEAGARSATSHTGAMAGSDRMHEAFFEQLGIIRVKAFSDLLDVAALLATGRRLKGRRLGILTSTGGAGVLLADSCGVLGLDTPPPEPELAARLSQLLRNEGAITDRNPIDITLAGLKQEVFVSAITAMQASATYDGLVVVVGASGLADPNLAAGPIIECAGNSDKPLVAYVSPYAPNILSHLNRNCIPTFDTPEGCAAALAALARQEATKARREAAKARQEARGKRQEVAGRPAALPLFLGESGGEGVAALRRLNESEAKQLFAHFGIPAVREMAVGSAAEAAEAAARVGGNVVLKVLSRDISHKTEVGGVAVGVAARDVEVRAKELLNDVRRHQPGAKLDGLLVQEQVTGTEVILGLAHDPQLGAAILLGAGGVTAEVLEDYVLRFPPLDLDEARAMIGSLKSYQLLLGYRGSPAGDVEALAACIVGFSEMVLELGPELCEAEINPLFVLPEGQGAKAADGLVVLSDKRSSHPAIG